jgi:hypothetical protein
MDCDTLIIIILFAGCWIGININFGNFYEAVMGDVLIERPSAEP